MKTKQIVGIFTNENDLYHATDSARQAHIPIVDAYTPYPVHGLEEAMGLSQTRLGQVCFLLGLLGLFCALSFQVWTSTWSWPLNIGGKSFLALPALMPVTFEVTILFAALGTVLTFFIRAKLWPGKRIERAEWGVSDDRFVLVLEPSEAQENVVQELFKKAETVQEIEVVS